MNENLNLWLIPLLPLMGAVINGVFGRRFPKSVINVIALAFPGASFLMALWIGSRFSGLAVPHIETVGRWIQAGTFSVDFAYQLDQLSMVMLLVVTGVGF